MIASLVALFKVRPFLFLLRLLAEVMAVSACAAAVGLGTVVGYWVLTHDALAANL